MSDDTEFTFDTKQAQQQVKSMTESLDKLLATVQRLDKAELNKVQQELDRLTKAGTTSAAAMAKGIGSALDQLKQKMATTGRVDYSIVKEIRNLQAQAVAEIRKGISNMEMVHAEMQVNTRTAWKNINQTAMEEARKLGAAYSELGSLVTKNAINLQRGKNATPMNIDETRLFLGLPSRDEMKTLAQQIKSQMQESLATEKLRAKGATSMNLDDTRAMFGLPDRNEMKTLAQQIKSQMQESLGTEKLRASSATSMNIDDTRALFGLPDRSEMKTLAQQIKSQMQDALANEKLRTRSATSMNIDDTRALFGLPDRNEMKTFAEQIKGQMQDALATEKLRARSATKMSLDDTRALLGLPSTSDMQRLKAQLQSETQEALRVQASVTAPKISRLDLDDLKYKESMTSMRAFYSEMEKGVSTVNNTGTAFKKLTVDGNDVHSMARGLASGFNLLWLTWGNLLPLFTGAGISFGLKKTFDIGSEVEYLIKFMETLGQTTDFTGKKMEFAGTIIRQELRNIDQTTMFSLTELSKAMVTLGQAGLSPAESLKTLRPAADLAAVGMVDLKTTTDLLIQTNALFGLSVDKTSATAAKIFQVTKSGVLNVEDIAGSMKYASEANTRFGKSLEETLTLLGALAQAGLKGASGGTALINFYRDLNGRSGPAIKAMRDLEKATGSTIKVFDEFGKQRSGIDIFNDINEAASKLKAQDADKLLAKIFSDRGGRTFFAMVRDGTIDLKKMQEQLEKTDPQTLFDSARGMMDTTRGALNILQGSLVGALDQVFEAYSGKFKGFIQDITKVIDSNEFKLAVAGIVDGVSRIYSIISNNAGLITGFFAAWAGIKVVGTGIAIFQSLAMVLAGMAPTLAMTTTAYARQTLAVQSNSMALIENVAANRAAAAGMTETAAAAAGAAAATRVAAVSSGVAGVAMRGLGAVIGFLANPVVGLVATVGMLGYAFMSTKNSAEAGMSGAAQAVTANGTIIESQLLKEISLARQRNSLVAGGEFASEEAKVNQMAADNAKRGRQVQFLLEKADNEKFSDATRREARQLANKELATMSENERVINAARDQINQGKLDTIKRQEEMERKARADSDKAAARAKAEAEASAIKGGGGAGRQDFGKYKIGQDNELSMLEKGMNDRLATIKKSFDNEKQLTDAYYNAGIMSQGQYQAAVLDQTVKYENESIDTIRKANEEYLLAYEDRYNEINAKLKDAKAAGNTAAIEQLTSALENLNRTKATTIANNLEKVTQIEEAAMTRMRMSVIKAEGEIIKLSKATDDYWMKDRAEKVKAAQLQEVADKYRFINESLLSTDAARKAADEAGVNEAAKHAAKLEELQKELQKMEEGYYDYAMAILMSGKYQTEEGQKELEMYQKRIDKLQELINLSKANSGAAVAYASQTAYDRAIQAQQDTLTRSVADAVVTGLTEGGKSGRKKLRDLIVAELKKPITLYIQALISPLMAGAFQMLGIGGGNQSGGGTSFSQMNTIAQSIGKNVGSAFTSFATSDLGARLGLSNPISTAVNNPSAYIAEGAKIPNVISDFGQTISNGLSMLTNTLAGFSIGSGLNNMISGGYSTGKGMDKLQQVGVLIGSAIGGPLVGALVGAVSGIFNRLFGRKLKDTGIEGTFGGTSGFEGQSYSFYEGGLFRSDKTKYSELDKEIAKFMQDSFKKMRTEVAFFADALGLDASKIANFTSKVKISLMGLNQEQAQAAFQEALATANNELAEQVLGTWETTTEKVSRTIYENVGGSGEDQVMVSRQIEEEITTSKYKPSEFAKDGEKAIDTLKRLATSLITVNGAFDTLGYKLVEASLKGGDLASKIIDAFGDIDKFIAATDSYYKNFYSDSERKAITQRQLEGELGKLGLKLPKTREEYRRLVEAQDLNTEAGRKAFAMLVQLSGGFAEISDEIKSLDDILQDAFDALEAAYKRQIDIAKKNVDAAQKVVDSLKPLVEFLNDSIKELYNSVSSTSKMSAQQGSAFIDNAVAELRRSGKLPDVTELTDAVTAMRDGFSSTIYSSQFEEDNARLVLAGKLEAIRAQAEPQLTLAEQALKVAKDTLATLEAELDMYTEQMRIAKEGLDATKDIATAVRDFQAALLAQQNAGKTPGTSGGSSGSGGQAVFGPGGSTGQNAKEIKPGMKSSDGKYYVEQFLGPYGSVFNPANADQQTRLTSLEDEAKKAWADATASGNVADLFNSLKSQGITLTEAAALYGFYYEDVLKASEAAGVGRFAMGGFHHGGLRMVGEDGPEVEATGAARIWNAKQMAQAVSGYSEDSSSNDEVLVELQNSVADMRAANVAVISELKDMRRIFSAWDINGLPKERVET